MSDDVSRYQPNRSLELDEPDKLKQVLRVMGNFKATVSCPWLSSKFQAMHLSHLRPRMLVGRTLKVAIGEDLAFQCNWLESGGK